MKLFWIYRGVNVATELLLKDKVSFKLFVPGTAKAFSSEKDTPEIFKSLDLPAGRYVWGYASTDDLDSQGDQIELEAISKAGNQLTVAPYNKVFLNHNYQDIAIAKIVFTKTDNNGLLILAKVNDDHARAGEVWKSIQEGYLDGFSVGGDFVKVIRQFKQEIGKYVNIVKELILREVSLTSIPANRKAGVLGAFVKVQKLVEENKMQENIKQNEGVPVEGSPEQPTELELIKQELAVLKQELEAIKEALSAPAAPAENVEQKQVNESGENNDGAKDAEEAIKEKPEGMKDDDDPIQKKIEAGVEKALQKALNKPNQRIGLVDSGKQKFAQNKMTKSQKRDKFMEWFMG